MINSLKESLFCYIGTHKWIYSYFSRGKRRVLRRECSRCEKIQYSRGGQSDKWKDNYNEV
jgi:hypothetical protein